MTLTLTTSARKSLSASIARRCRISAQAQRLPPRAIDAYREYYATRIVEWANDWVWTYDPRLVSQGLPGYVPFDLWPRQVEYLIWLEERAANGEEFVVVKSRDVGVSWLNCTFGAHKWLFRPGYKTTFAANKADNVDRRGDLDSLFEKMRLLLRNLPTWQLPAKGWNSAYMRLSNLDNGNILDGESGANAGRAGRATVYLIDEAAHLEQQERVDAATVATSPCRGWCSSVYGTGGLFARKAQSGDIPVFRFHWSDDPRKTGEWAADMRRNVDSVVFAQEYDIDFGASVEQLCIENAWVQSSIDLRRHLEADPKYRKQLDHWRSFTPTAGLDVGGGRAKSVLVLKHGPLLDVAGEWQTADGIDVAYGALAVLEETGGQLNYDNIGVGYSVTTALTRREPGGRTDVEGINVGLSATGAIWPDGRYAKDIFLNLKAELWWKARAGFQRAHELWLHIRGQPGGVEHELEDVLLLDNHQQLRTQLGQPKWHYSERGGKIQMEPKEKMAARQIKSPDHADAMMLALYDSQTAIPLVAPVGIPNERQWPK